MDSDTASASEQSSDPLETVLTLSRRMLAAGRRADWAAAAALEVERRRALEQLFGSGVAAETPDRTAAAVREMLDLDHELSELARAARERVGSELQQLRHARRAAAVYRTCPR